jgi:RNA polymerase sigma-70 factor, ECF subfamily
VRRDDREIWTDCLRQHGPAMVLFARQWASTHADAEDVVQEAVIRCWRRRRHIDDLRTYLFAAIRRCAMDHRRARTRRARHEQHAHAVVTEPMFANHPAARIGQLECQTRTKQTLAFLPAEQREVVVMKIWADMTFQQIADVLAISPNTAASRYRYALNRLRALLNEGEDH